MCQIIAFGDSITYGFWDKEGGWVARLRKYLEKKVWVADENWYVYNLGNPGDTSREILNRFKSETNARLNNTPVIFIFAVGTNDSQLLLQENNRVKITLNEYRENLQKIIKTGQEYSSQIIFLGLTLVKNNRTDEESVYKNKNIKKYDQVLKEICAANNVYYIDIISRWKKQNYKTLLEDGLHPNSKGHKIIFETVKTFLEEKKLI